MIHPDCFVALRNFLTNYAKIGDKYECSGFPIDLVNVALYAPSPSGKLLAIIRTIEGGTRKHSHISSNEDREKDEGKYRIEIWDRTRLRHIISVEGKHGQVYNDGLFSSFFLSFFVIAAVFVVLRYAASQSPRVYRLVLRGAPTKTLVCVASRRCRPRAFGPKENERRSSKFEYLDDWGEVYAGKTRPALFLCKLADRSVTRLAGVPADVSPGQPVVLSDAAHVLFVGWRSAPYRLGVKYCYNRASGVLCYSSRSAVSSYFLFLVCVCVLLR